MEFLKVLKHLYLLFTGPRHVDIHLRKQSTRTKDYAHQLKLRDRAELPAHHGRAALGRRSPYSRLHRPLGHEHLFRHRIPIRRRTVPHRRQKLRRRAVFNSR